MLPFLDQAKSIIARAVQRAAKTDRNLKKGKRALASTAASSTAVGRDGIRAFIGGGAAPRQVPVHRMQRIGITDHSVDLSFVVGTVYVGNGTLGVGTNIYFKDTQGNVWSSPVPVYVHDTDSSPKLVPSYANDVTKHFAGYDIEELFLEFASKQPSTSIALTLITAPYRGAGFAPVFGTGTPAALTVATALSVSGMQRMAGYESRLIDMKPYIANGGGSRQNSFLTSAYQAGASTTAVIQTRGAPCGFLVAGLGDAGGSMNGFETHDVIVRCRLRLRDFIGTQYITNGFGGPRRPDEKVGVSPVQTGPALPGVVVHGLADITDNSTTVPMEVTPFGHPAIKIADGFGSSVGNPLHVDVVTDSKDKTQRPPEGPIPGPPPLRQVPPEPSTSVPALHSAAKQLGFVLVRKGDVNTPAPIKDDHFEKPTKS
jgi:hypothetical protein